MFLNLSILLSYLLSKLISAKSTIALTSGTLSFSACVAIVFTLMDLKTITKFLYAIFLKGNTPILLCYMAVTLAVSLWIANWMSNSEAVPFYVLRKWFHIIVIYLFVPGVYMNFKMMTFAFNCVTVLMI